MIDKNFENKPKPNPESVEYFRQSELSWSEYRANQRRMETLIDSLETSIGEIDVTKENFFSDLKRAEREETEKLIGEPPLFEGPAPERKLYRPSFIDGAGAEYLLGLGQQGFMCRLLSRDLFNALERDGVLSGEDKDMFLNAMPRYSQDPSLSDSDQQKLLEAKKAALDRLLDHDRIDAINQLLDKRQVTYSLIRRMESSPKIKAEAIESISSESELSRDDFDRIEADLDSVYKEYGSTWDHSFPKAIGWFQNIADMSQRVEDALLKLAHKQSE